jgi:hypothetical protein
MLNLDDTVAKGKDGKSAGALTVDEENDDGDDNVPIRYALPMVTHQLVDKHRRIIQDRFIVSYY